MDIVKNGGGQSVHKTLKLVVFEKGINVINWFFCMLLEIQES